jgi:hypothetical protein
MAAMSAAQLERGSTCLAGPDDDCLVSAAGSKPLSIKSIGNSIHGILQGACRREHQFISLNAATASFISNRAGWIIGQLRFKLRLCISRSCHVCSSNVPCGPLAHAAAPHQLHRRSAP